MSSSGLLKGRKAKPNANTRTLPPSPSLRRDKPPRQVPGRVVIVPSIAPPCLRNTGANAVTTREGFAVRSLGFLAFRGLSTQHILTCKEPLQVLQSDK